MSSALIRFPPPFVSLGITSASGFRSDSNESGTGTVRRQMFDARAAAVVGAEFVKG
jgi:hypothetical protein